MLIVHISDLHIGVGGLSRDRTAGLGVASDAALVDLADAGTVAAVRAALELDGDHAALTVCSGDYSGDGNGLNQGLAYVETVARLHARLTTGLQSLPLSRGVLGNHDIWGGESPLMSWLHADRKLADAEHVFGRPRVARWDEPPVAPAFGVGRLAVHLYFVDSNAAGVRNVFARGRVRTTDLDRLAKLLDADMREHARGQPMLRIAVMHHPPVAHCHHLTMKLENAAEVTDFLADHGFGIVLCGHEHAPAVDRLRHGLWQCIAGTACQTESRRGLNTFLAITVEDDVRADPAGRATTSVTFHRFERSYDGRDDRFPFRASLHQTERVAIATN